MQKYGTGPSGDFHARYGGADGVKGGGQVDGDDRVPLVDRKLLDRRNMLDASIVHQYVERAERRLMLGHHFGDLVRSEEHTSELQSLMRISYAVFCLKKKKQTNKKNNYKQ